MKTFTNRSNCVRAARKELEDTQARDGVHFAVTEAGGKFSYSLIPVLLWTFIRGQFLGRFCLLLQRNLPHVIDIGFRYSLKIVGRPGPIAAQAWPARVTRAVVLVMLATVLPLNAAASRVRDRAITSRLR